MADADADPNEHKDQHGHGTHVVRLLLKFAPRAEIFVAKISDTKSLTLTRAHRLSEVSNLLLLSDLHLQLLIWYFDRRSDRLDNTPTLSTFPLVSSPCP